MYPLSLVTESGIPRPTAVHSILSGSSPVALHKMLGFSPGRTICFVGFNSILGTAEKIIKIH